MAYDPPLMASLVFFDPRDCMSVCVCLYINVSNKENRSFFSSVSYIGSSLKVVSPLNLDLDLASYSFLLPFISYSPP
jgi:hypothetical protein